jgi:hypothetical protein
VSTTIIFKKEITEMEQRNRKEDEKENEKLQKELK